MSVTKRRAWWWTRQGLDGSLAGASTEAALLRCGWSRSVGGASPYLALFARAGLSRAAVDLAVAERRVHELPAARGCTYVVSAPEYGLAMWVADGGAEAEVRTARKLGVTDAEIEALCVAVLQALDGRELDPDGLRAATGDLSRSLGPEGKKKGLTTTLPLALGLLQDRGEVRRVPANGRLDAQRYRYARWAANPKSETPLPGPAARTDLARRWWRWAGPATLAEFQWFSGLGARAVQEAVAPLRLSVAAGTGERLLLPDDVAAWTSFTGATGSRYALLGSLDPLLAHRREGADLCDERDRARIAAAWESAPLGGSLSDLPSHTIWDRGRLVGLWDWDAAASTLRRALWVPLDDELRACIERTEAYVRDELGDARTFSLDSPQSRGERLRALQRLGSGPD
jgi:hypothetical protein